MIADLQNLWDAARIVFVVYIIFHVARFALLAIGDARRAIRDARARRTQRAPIFRSRFEFFYAIIFYGILVLMLPLLSLAIR